MTMVALTLRTCAVTPEPGPVPTGVNEAPAGRMKNGRYILDFPLTSFERPALLARVFRSLDAIAGGDVTTIRGRMTTAKTAFAPRPAEPLTIVLGLAHAPGFPDARRAPL
jgi:hypothetical protein